MFNPFVASGASNGGGGDGNGERIRYSIEKIELDGVIGFRLIQTINSSSSYVGDLIKFNGNEIFIENDNKNISQIIQEINQEYNEISQKLENVVKSINIASKEDVDDIINDIFN